VPSNKEESDRRCIQHERRNEKKLLKFWLQKMERCSVGDINVCENAVLKCRLNKYGLVNWIALAQGRK
jgi:hypothetical protein